MWDRIWEDPTDHNFVVQLFLPWCLSSSLLRALLVQRQKNVVFFGEKLKQLKGSGFNIPNISLSAAGVVIKSSRVLQHLELQATEWGHTHPSVSRLKRREISPLLLANGYHRFGQSISLRDKPRIHLESVWKWHKLPSWGVTELYLQRTI